jgi:hypothetical protein
MFYRMFELNIKIIKFKINKNRMIQIINLGLLIFLLCVCIMLYYNTKLKISRLGHFNKLHNLNVKTSKK